MKDYDEKHGTSFALLEFNKAELFDKNTANVRILNDYFESATYKASR